MTTEYKICQSDCHWELEKSVNAAIKDGWRPVGGVAVSMMWRGERLTSITRYSQAMIREAA